MNRNHFEIKDNNKNLHVLPLRLLCFLLPAWYFWHFLCYLGSTKKYNTTTVLDNWDIYIYIICTFKMNTRPIHLHMSVCFEERSIEQYLLFLFITCKWSGRVFYTRFNETVHLSKTAYRLTACRRSGSRSVRGCGTFDTLVCIEIPQSCLRRSHDLWEQT